MSAGYASSQTQTDIFRQKSGKSRESAMRSVSLFFLFLLFHLTNGLRWRTKMMRQIDCPEETKGQLVFTQWIWRHGDRSPKAAPYPNDYHNTFWSRGWGQLTEEGMRQLKELGTFGRKCYGSLVESRFHSDEVYIKSSAKDRALVSAQAFLNGFFPPTDGEKFESSLNWQPIPVYSAEKGAEDALLKPSRFRCDKYDQYSERVLSELFSEFHRNFSDVVKMLEKVSGYSKIGLDEVLNIGEVSKEIIHQLPQPEWILKRWKQYGNKSTLEILRIAELAERMRPLADREMARLKGGLLVGDFLKNAMKIANMKEEVLEAKLTALDKGREWTNEDIEKAEKKAKKKKAKKNKKKGKQLNKVEKKKLKMIMYSSHDGTLTSFLHALGHSNISVPYAAAIIMEIRKRVDVVENPSEQYWARFIYRHNGTVENLELEGCGKECTVEQLYGALEEKRVKSVKQLYEECEREEEFKPLVKQMPKGGLPLDHADQFAKKKKKSKRRVCPNHYDDEEDDQDDGG